MSLSNFLQETLRTNLKAFPAESFADNQPLMIRGINTIGDIAPEVWSYDSTSMAVANDTTVMRPNDLTAEQAGRFIKRFVFNIGTSITPAINTTPARVLNTNFTTGNVGIGFYSITCNVTNPLLIGASTANAYVEFSTDGGTTWQPVLGQTGNSSSVGVAVAIQLTNGQTSMLTVPLAANTLHRIRTVTTGTANISLVGQCEINF